MTIRHSLYQKLPVPQSDLFNLIIKKTFIFVKISNCYWVTFPDSSAGKKTKQNKSRVFTLKAAQCAHWSWLRHSPLQDWCCSEHFQHVRSVPFSHFPMCNVNLKKKNVNLYCLKCCRTDVRCI